MPPPDYIAAELAEWRANFSQIIPALNNRDASLLEKIKNHDTIFGGTEALIEAEIRTNRMFAATFTKSPSRGDYDKRLAQTWLDQELNFQFGLNTQVTRLPQRGTGVLYVLDNGDIAPFTGELKPSKALTFKWKIGAITYYALHKYTRQSGGAQKTQFTATARTLKNFQNATNQDKVLIVITDGDYYTPQKMAILQALRNQARPRSFAVPIEDVHLAIRQCP